jgi:hypothetical protein
MTLFLFYVINIFKVKQSYDLMIELGYIGDINREREREKRKGLFFFFLFLFKRHKTITKNVIILEFFFCV